jgi:hypothetical protein
MKEAARLIIPVWGEPYVSDVLSLTLPAVLSPGNLPALSDMFEVELVVVTETRLFEVIRGSKSFQVAAKLCAVRLVALDDLLVAYQGDYGTILTYALFRGLADLGERMTETCLFFLNADFLISDGSLRHVGRLLLQGERMIHAPSFRVVLEDVWPRLSARVDKELGTLCVPSRDMAKLALAHKHPTVRARTVNQRLYHQTWMDQFYWYVDEETLIGHQSPMALVAIKPQSVVGEPKAFWDYGFVPEAGPTLKPHFITDSDDFFMIEPQGRDHQATLVHIGWATVDKIARTEVLRATKEHRQSVAQLLKIHAGDLPADLQDSIDEARAFMAEIYRLASLHAAPHVGHPVLSWWGGSSPAISALHALRTMYQKTFGSPPKVGKSHPLWIEIAPVQQKIAEWKNGGKTNILSITSDDLLRHRCLDAQSDRLFNKAPFDACICELTLKDLRDLGALYPEVRSLVKDGGQVLFKVTNPVGRRDDAGLFLSCCRFPDIDVSEIRFYGTPATAWWRAVYVPALRPIPSRPIMRGLGICALILLAPLVRLANARAERRNPAVFSPRWTTLMLEFTVRRARPRQTKPPLTGDAARPKMDDAVR